MAGQVFVSYRSEDKVSAERICLVLEREGIQCWIAPRNIPAGREWATAIVEAIQGCGVFVMVLSSNSKNAKQISREAELADRRGVPIITFRIEDVEPPPSLMYFLGNVQWLDGFGSQFDSALGQLAQLVRAAPEAAEKQTSGLSNAPIPEDLRRDLNVPATATFTATSAAAAPAAAREIPVVIDEASKEVGQSPMQSGGGSTPWLKIGLVVALAVAVIVAGLLLLRRPGPSAGDVKEARTVAKRFLNERDAGDFEAAWNEYSPAFRGAENRAAWEKGVRAPIKEHGQPQNAFKSCTPDKVGFICDYTLRFPDGTASNQKLWLEKESDGAWAIARGTFTQVH